MSTLADLTTAQAVQIWCGVTPSTSADPMFSALATSASRAILNYINRPAFNKTSFVELYDGNGRQRMQLRNWPVTTVNSLIINGITVPASTSAPGTSNASPNGHWLEAATPGEPGQMQSLSLFGFYFSPGRQNVGLNYTAGYYIDGETHVVTAGMEKLTLDQPYGPWTSDLGVLLNGVVMTKVANAPSTGQYQVVADNPGVYQFATADVGKTVAVSYNYVLNDIRQAATELAGERYKYKDRIGKMSASLGGQETTTYSLKGIPDAVKVMIDPYRNVVPY